MDAEHANPRSRARRSAVLTPRATNLAILVLVVLELASGLGGFLVGEPDGRWVFWLHRAGGLALVALLLWKAGIARRSFRRRGVRPGTAVAALGGVLLLASLATGVLWTSAETGNVPVPVFGSWTVLSLHVALSLLLVPPFLAHVRLRWPRPRPADVAGRRSALRLLALLAVGLAAWGAQEAFSARFAGSARRFTGSRETASFAGNAHPVTNWLADPVPEVSPDEWQLLVSGGVGRKTVLSYAEVLALGTTAGAAREAALDCTGGWYTTQRWRGVPVAALLENAGTPDGARSLVVRSSTGYARRFPLAEAGDLLLATHVGGETLSAGHGFPLRLVAPGRRGYEWVKWVAGLEVSRDPAWLEPPLPLQ